MSLSKGMLAMSLDVHALLVRLVMGDHATVRWIW